MFFEISLRVRYAETDAMGIAHHSHFLIWLEYARMRWFDVLGMPYKELEEKGYFLPVAEATVRYRKPVFFDDTLRIKLTVEEPIRARFCLSYQIIRGKEIVAEAKTVHVFINAQRKIILPPNDFLAILDAWRKDKVVLPCCCNDSTI